MSDETPREDNGTPAAPAKPASPFQNLSSGDKGWLKAGVFGALAVLALLVVVALLTSTLLSEDLREYLSFVQIAGLLFSFITRTPISGDVVFYALVAAAEAAISVSVAIPFLTALAVLALAFFAHRAARSNAEPFSLKSAARGSALFAIPFTVLGLLTAIFGGLGGDETMGSFGLSANFFVQAIFAFVFAFLTSLIVRLVSSGLSGSLNITQRWAPWTLAARYVGLFFVVFVPLAVIVALVATVFLISQGASIGVALIVLLILISPQTIALLPATLLGVPWVGGVSGAADIPTFGFLTARETSASFGVLDGPRYLLVLTLLVLLVIAFAGVAGSLRRPVQSKFDHGTGIRAALVLLIITPIASWFISASISGDGYAGFLSWNAGGQFSIGFGITLVLAMLVNALLGYVLVVGGQALTPYVYPRFAEPLKKALGIVRVKVDSSWDAIASEEPAPKASEGEETS